MQLSVIILNYNVRYFLEQCLDSVQKAISGMDAEIIVVDNNSPDDSCTMVRKHFPSVKLIAHPENSGFPKGNNIGVKEAKGEYIVILNPDTIVAEDTFKKAIDFFESQDNPGIVGVKLIDGRGNFLPESKRGTPTPFVAFTKVAGLYKLMPRWFGKYYASHLTEDQSGEVEILVGAFMLMKRSLYLECGGFDENCFMYSDDIDLSYTVLKSGKQNYYFAGTTVIHYKGESTVKDRNYIRRFTEAMDFFYRKHFRRAVVFDLFMKVGAYFFTKAKASTSEPEVDIDKYWLISKDVTAEENLRKVIGDNLQRVTSVEEIDGNFSGNREIIFDAEEMSYREIIGWMRQLRSNKTTFKNLHKSTGFVIGSNSSNDRGKVIKVADRREGLPII